MHYFLTQLALLLSLIFTGSSVVVTNTPTPVITVTQATTTQAALENPHLVTAVIPSTVLHVPIMATTTATVTPMPSSTPISPIYTPPVVINIIPPPVEPTFTGTQPIIPTPPVLGSINTPEVTEPTCDTTPVVSINFSTSTLTITSNPDGYVNVTTEVKDACGTEYPYNVTMGIQPLASHLSAHGIKTWYVSTGNVWYWEQDPAQNPSGNWYTPFPITVTTASTSIIQTVNVN